MPESLPSERGRQGLRRRDQHDLARLDGDAVGEGRLAEKQAQLTGELAGLKDAQHHPIGIAHLQRGGDRVDERVLAVVDPVQHVADGHRAPLPVSLERRDHSVGQPRAGSPFQLLVIEILEHCPDLRFDSRRGVRPLL